MLFSLFNLKISVKNKKYASFTTQNAVRELNGCKSKHEELQEYSVVVSLSLSCAEQTVDC